MGLVRHYIYEEDEDWYATYIEPPYFRLAFKEYVHCSRLHVSSSGPFETVLMVVFDLLEMSPIDPSPVCRMVAF